MNVVVLKFLSLLILILSNSEVLSQTRVRTKPYLRDVPPVNKFYIELPLQQKIPPIEEDMPYNVKLSYEVMDSFSRLEFQEWKTENWLKKVNTNNDTIQTIWKFANEMMDYDPLRLHQYLVDQYQESVIYKNRSTFNFNIFLKKIYEIKTPNNLKLYAALNSCFILKVKVISVDSLETNRLRYNNDTSKLKSFQISCIVLDTIKGKVIPMKKTKLRNIENETKASDSTISPIFNFFYASNSYPKYEKRNIEFDRKPTLHDSLIYDFSQNILRIKPKQELIVFLDSRYLYSGKSLDYFQLTIDHRYSKGILPIVDGMVSDVNKIWSDNTWIPYETWKEKYNEVVDIIMNKKY
jgi:hypothetical protein